MEKEQSGVCPVCNGTKRIPATGAYSHVVAGYDKETKTLPCDNCGAQCMWGTATGSVPLRPDGTPCKHDYSEHKIGNCLREYVCVYCKHAFQIDSGD